MEKTSFFDMGCRAGLFWVWGCFWTLTFLANLLLNVNMLLTSPTYVMLLTISKLHI